MLVIAFPYLFLPVCWPQYHCRVPLLLTQWGWHLHHIHWVATVAPPTADLQPDLPLCIHCLLHLCGAQRVHWTHHCHLWDTHCGYMHWLCPYKHIFHTPTYYMHNLKSYYLWDPITLDSIPSSPYPTPGPSLPSPPFHPLPSIPSHLLPHILLFSHPFPLPSRPLSFLLGPSPFFLTHGRLTHPLPSPLCHPSRNTGNPNPNCSSISLSRKAAKLWPLVSHVTIIGLDWAPVSMCD